MKTIAWLTGLGLIVLVATSFKVTKNPSRIDLIMERLDTKVTEFIAVNKRRCIEKALEEASMQVDSILLERAKSSRDTLNKPTRPTKPNRPEVLIPKDSLELAPIFRDTTAVGIE